MVNKYGHTSFYCSSLYCVSWMLCFSLDEDKTLHSKVIMTHVVEMFALLWWSGSTNVSSNVSDVCL